MIAFLKCFSCPFISSRSSGIEVNPRRANMTTPIGIAKFVGLMVVRLCGFMFGRNLMKTPRTIVIIPMTPQVSIFFNSLRPSLSRRVMIIQKVIPRTIGLMLPGKSFDRDSPSPIR